MVRGQVPEVNAAERVASFSCRGFEVGSLQQEFFLSGEMCEKLDGTNWKSVAAGTQPALVVSTAHLVDECLGLHHHPLKKEWSDCHCVSCSL